MTLRRMLPFLFLNIIVSATVVMLILSWWDSQQEEETAVAAATEIAITAPAATMAAATILAVTDTPAPGDDPAVYIVQSGDTLGSISTEFDVPLEDIMIANELTSADFIFVGQALVIPIGGLPTATPEPPEPTLTPTPNIPPSPIPTEPLSIGEVDIQITEVIGLGQLTEEAVSVANLGSRAVALQGWTLSDAEGRVFTFGQVTLFGDGAAILIHTEAGQNGPSDQYWGQEQAVWASGETVTLKDAEGTVQAQYTIP